jgi:hypothetical protein
MDFCVVAAVINGVWQKPVRFLLLPHCFYTRQKSEWFYTKNPNRVNEIYTGR